ncbi:hypothetical protein K1719_019077 [Acacia pycnantha]|nr:hypothetical protein K1719_019077 [Acacia pycnantha]
MENKKPPMRYWNNMSYDILLKIFMTLNMVDFSTVSLVCSSWRKACQDPVFWDGKVFDLSDMSLCSAANLSFESNNDSSGDEPSNSTRLTQFLKCALDLSCGKISCFIFNFLQSINDDDLILVAERTANLKRLVLPRSNIQLSKTGVHKAMQLWKGLESLTLTDISIAYDIVEAIGEHCNNFSELKVTCDFGVNFANALIKHLPKLKILSLQSILVSKNALVLVANNLKDLKILNVSHSFIVGLTDDGTNMRIYSQHDVPKILGNNNMFGISTLIRCEGICGMCLKVLQWNICTDEWKNTKEEVWRDDKIANLRF